jgi:tetratricopeptide (TPR) repeat protein
MNTSEDKTTEIIAMGKNLLRISRYPEALDAFDNALRIDPKNIDAWRLKGLVLRYLERYEDELYALDKALEIDPQNAEIWLIKGLALGNQRKNTEAVDALNKALKIDPKNANTWEFKGRILNNLGRYDEALEAIDQALKISPNHKDAWQSKNQVLRNMRRVEENDSISQACIPERFSIGQNLDWEASPIPVTLYVELPFWIMVPDCLQEVVINDCRFDVEIKDNYIEKYACAFGESRSNCIYIGPPESWQSNPDLEKFTKEGNVPIMDRKCKTVLCIHSACNKDVLTAAGRESTRSREAHFYLGAFCEAHLEVINHLIQHYRLSTYDFFPYEVSPWDVPIWFVGSEVGIARVILQNYAAWDEKPAMYKTITASGPNERYELIKAHELQSALSLEPSAGEYELLDASNFMERGDYSGAVRRITTAIEVQLESVLRQELLKIYPVAEVEEKLKDSENDFPGRRRQYQKLSGRKLSAEQEEDLESIRTLRHSIVHNAYRISLNERELAQRAVDTGRWIFNWLENQPTREDIRGKRIAKRSLGRRLMLFSAKITPHGVIVYNQPH